MDDKQLQEEVQREVKEEVQSKKTLKPKPRMHIDEFLLNSDLRAEQKAGFRVFVGKLYSSESEWKTKLEEYKNRRYEGGAEK